MKIVNSFFDPKLRVFWNNHESMSIELAKEKYGRIIDVDFFAHTNQHKEMLISKKLSKPIGGEGNE